MLDGNLGAVLDVLFYGTSSEIHRGNFHMELLAEAACKMALDKTYI